MPPKTKKKTQFLNQKTHNDDLKKKKKQTYEPQCWIEQWRATKTLTLGGSSSPFVFFDFTTTHVFSLFLLSSFLPFPFLSFFSLSSFLLALRTPTLKRKPTFSPFQFCFLCAHPLSKENLFSHPFNFHAHTHSPKRATSEVKWFSNNFNLKNKIHLCMPPHGIK